MTNKEVTGKTQLSKSTVYEAIHGRPGRNVPLLGRGLVKAVEEEMWKTGLKKYTYGLTFQGLIRGLGSSADAWVSVDAVAKRWKDLLPHVFGKWNVFKECGLGEEVMQRLQYLIHTFPEIGIGPDDTSYYDYFVQCFYLKSISSFRPWQLREPLGSELSIWKPVLTNDEELKGYFLKQLESRKTQLEQETNIIENGISFVLKVSDRVRGE